MPYSQKENMKNKKLLVILLVVLIIVPIIRVRNTQADIYPVLEWDMEEIPAFVGKVFIVIFTCFSDSNETIHVEIWLDGIDFEWEAHESYFVNQKVLIDTKDQLPGRNHKLEIKARDYLNREKTLTAIFTIDSVPPVFNKLEVYPFEDEKVTIDINTDIMIVWNITDEYFYEFYVYRDYDRIMITSDEIGSWNYSYYSTKQLSFVLRCVAMDLANNTVERSFQVSYTVKEGEYVPVEDIEQIIIEHRKQLRIGLGSFVTVIIVVMVVGVPFAVVISNKKKEYNI